MSDVTFYKNSLAETIEHIFHGVEGGAHWLTQVIMGEWAEDRPTSAIIADALIGLNPAFSASIIIRDLSAVIVRMAKHPERRTNVNEWILVVGMLLPVALAVIGLAADGVGALVGVELGMFLRSVTLLLVKKGGVALKTIVEFFRSHGYGDVIAALRKINYAKYTQPCIDALTKKINSLILMIHSFVKKVHSLGLDDIPSWMGRDGIIHAVNQGNRLINALADLKKVIGKYIPEAIKEVSERLNALFAGDLKAATQIKHTINAATTAPKIARAVPVTAAKAVQQDSKATGSTAKVVQQDSKAASSTAKVAQQNSKATGSTAEAAKHSAPTPQGTLVQGKSEKGKVDNTRRVPEKRIAVEQLDASHKSEQEFRFLNGEKVPVGAKPFKEGETVFENPPLVKDDWDEMSSKVKEGYPNLTAPDYRGNETTKYDTFSTLEPVEYNAGTLQRVIAHDSPEYSNTGAFWTEGLPADGQALRADTAVKESWNKNGTYVDVTVPPADHPLWLDDAFKDSTPTLKGWKGDAASQRYEYIDPATGNKVKDDFYLVGGGEQVFLDSKQLEAMKKHDLISERKPTNFPDYDPNIKNGDGSTGNIVPKGELIFENIPHEEAMLKNTTQPKDTKND